MRHPLTRRGQKVRVLTQEENLLLTVVYLRQSGPGDAWGARVGLSESSAQKRYPRDRERLVQNLRLPGKKALRDQGLQALLLDVTEQPIERPGKGPRPDYSGTKNRQTIKAQLIGGVKTLPLLLVGGGKGRPHDFALLKPCRLRILKDLKKSADSGDQGRLKLAANRFTPRKASTPQPRTPEDKHANREVAKLRITIAPVNRRGKIFRMVKETDRGKHHHDHKTWTVVAAFVNLRYTT